MTGGRNAGFLQAWGPVGLWAAGILILTTVPIPAAVETGGLPLDKVIHAAMYSGLGWTVARALHLTSRSTGGALALAVVAAAAFAAVDEWHQGWVGREPALGDWVADAVGLVLGLGLFLWRRGGRPVEPGQASETSEAPGEPGASETST